ncbi:galactose-specific lectin nattectin-like [Colossoma macropomum]|uniref:galactose-specific lectin nattectin-like n=1 Tax=Colossoma macropomum TaxID=42526 RepID=UPI0018647774|nr:galactose-specific lectin nattectin-like [Colossoma macropomum]
MADLADTAPKIKHVSKIPVWIPYGSRQFKFFAIKLTWPEAERTCKQSGAFLASVHDKNEDNFIKSLIKRHTGQDRPTWLGGSQNVLNRWVWSDGSAFNFSPWTKGEPNGSGRCLQTNYNGGWDDHVCTVKQSFVCARQTRKG